MAPWGGARGRSVLSAADAARAIDAALDAGSPSGVSAGVLAACARYLESRHGRVRPFVGRDARAVVREALARGLLYASREALRYVAAPPPEALDDDPLSHIPLASDVLEQLYEKGIEVEDDLVDEEPDGVELEASVNDPAFDYIEDASACEPEPEDAIHDTSHTEDDAATGAPATGGDDAATGEPAAAEGDGAIECGAEVDDENLHSIDDASECTEPADADWGDALEPTEEPAAA